MSLSIKYERLEDARMRLRHTVVLYDGAPYYIREITTGTGDDGPYRVHADALPLSAADVRNAGRGEDADIRKYISSKNFDIAPFRMGFVNAKTGCFYVSRLPARQQKQGLGSENVQMTTPLGQRIPFATLLTTPEVLAMVNGNYPNLKQALAALEKMPSIAICRDVALVKDEVLDCLVYVYHKTTKVGLLSDNKAKLGKAFAYLNETISECGLEIAK